MHSFHAYEHAEHFRMGMRYVLWIFHTVLRKLWISMRWLRFWCLKMVWQAWETTVKAMTSLADRNNSRNVTVQRDKWKLSPKLKWENSFSALRLSGINNERWQPSSLRRKLFWGKKIWQGKVVQLLMKNKWRKKLSKKISHTFGIEMMLISSSNDSIS